MQAMIEASTPWFTPPTGDRPVLWCLPYAGGGASIFRGWDAALAPWVDVRPICLPGRDRRFSEVPFDDIALIARTLSALTSPWGHLPQAWFGHSMGAAVAYETVVQVQNDLERTPPRLLAVGGRAAPGFGRLRSPMHALPESDFIAKLVEMGGTPQAVLADEELMELYMPLLRADFKVIETWQPSGVKLTSTDLLVLGGKDDPETTPQRMEAWTSFSSRHVICEQLPGGHFFINTHREQVLELLRSHLSTRFLD